jgi:hypothetical protein
VTEAIDPTRVVVYPCILSYPNLFVPRKPKDSDDSEAGYDCELWFHNSNPKAAEVYQKLQMAVMAAAEAKFGKGSIPKTLKNPVRPSSDKESWTGEDGFWIRAKSKTKPLVSEKDPASSPQSPVFIPVTDHEKAYPGVIVAAAIRAGGFTFTDSKTKMVIKGVTFYLNQIILVQPGTRLVASTVRPPAEEFGDLTGQLDFQPISTDVGVAASGAMEQQSYPQAPAGMPQYPGMAHPMAPMPQYPGVPQYPGMTQPMPQMPAGMQYPGVPQYPGMPPQYPGMPYPGQ